MLLHSTQILIQSLLALSATTLVEGFVAPRPNKIKASLLNYRSSIPHSDTTPIRTEHLDDNDASPFSFDEAHTLDSSAFYQDYYDNNGPPEHGDPPSAGGVLDADPSQIDFVFPEAKQQSEPVLNQVLDHPAAQAKQFAAGSSSYYPFAAMMQGSAPYIADHAGKIVVFYLPGEYLDNKEASDALLEDMALCWLLGMKLVIVTGNRYSVAGECPPDSCPMEYSHECHNSLKVTDRATVRLVEEEAGYLRTEMERKLNRCLRAHGGTSHSLGDPTGAPPEGNVVSGNFYTAQRFGEVRGEDFQYTGFATETHTENIQQVLASNDVVLLSTVGLSRMGDVVSVNGYHLAATVAASLEASKLIYLSNQGCLLQKKNTDHPIQELPMSLAQRITKYHQVLCHNTGFATFQKAKESLPPAAVELLLHLGWAAWAVDHGVERSHVVNPGDGALLEELFTSKNGANTCLFHDKELIDNSTKDDRDINVEEWDAFFETAAASSSGGHRVAHFG